MTDVDISHISTLTDAQEKVLSLVPVLPATLSLFGSSTIIYMVMRESKRTPYRRLLLGMSLCDILFSVTFPLQAFLLPKESSQRVWAIGTDASCTALGFLAQLSFSAMFYNGLLSYYFLLTIRYGWKEEAFAKWIEPWMHVLAIGFPLVTATIGAIKGYYHEVELGPGCWVSDYPDGCDVPNSGIECTSPTIAWIFGGSILFFDILSLLINNLILYCHVRSTISVGHRRSSLRTIEISSSALREQRTRQAAVNDSQAKRVRAVATQAFLYVAGFVLSYLWTFLLRVMESMDYGAQDEASLFPLLVLQACFVPIQGFFNLLVYVRPRYLRVRTQFEDESRLWCFRRALFEDKIRPVSMQRSRMGSTRFSKADKSRSFGGFPVSQNSLSATADKNTTTAMTISDRTDQIMGTSMTGLYTKDKDEETRGVTTDEQEPSSVLPQDSPMP